MGGFLCRSSNRLALLSQTLCYFLLFCFFCLRRISSPLFIFFNLFILFSFLISKFFFIPKIIMIIITCMPIGLEVDPCPTQFLGLFNLKPAGEEQM